MSNIPRLVAGFKKKTKSLLGLRRIVPPQEVAIGFYAFQNALQAPISILSVSLSTKTLQARYWAYAAFARGFCFGHTVNHLGASAFSPHMENIYFIGFICLTYENLLLALSLLHNIVKCLLLAIEQDARISWLLL